MKHVKALTVKDKLARVIAGELGTTIRKYPLKHQLQRYKDFTPSMKNIVLIKPGDEILFHDCKGTEVTVLVTSIKYIKMYKEGINFDAIGGYFRNGIPHWGVTFRITRWEELDEFAKEDGFRDGKEMGEWFNNQYRLESFDNNQMDMEAQKLFQIIRFRLLDGGD